MLKRFIANGALALALAASLGAYASTPSEDLTATLAQKYPATHVDEIRPSNMEGVFEVVMGKNIAYTDAKADYLLFGHMYDMKTQKDITAERLATLNKVSWNDLPLKNAFKTVHGSGKRELAVFSDPDCPYCKKAEATLAALKDVTIYTFLFPIAQLHPSATSKAVSIWCAKNRAEAWRDAMISDVAPAEATCSNPIAENVALAQKLGINGTPTMIAKDGTMKPGAIPLEELNSWLK